MNNGGLLYEIRFRVEDRERFETWLPGVAVSWGSLPSVSSFRTFHGVEDDREWFRLVFEFAGYEPWQTFVRRRTHQDAMAVLDDLSATVERAIWVPSAVSLSQDGPPLVDLDDELPPH